MQLKDYERKIFSQNGEDGVIEHILHLIGFNNKYYVEFGVEDGSECNTRYLKQTYGFNGLLMDGRYHNDEIGLYQEFITAENINQLFKKYNVPLEFDLLSIDIDYNDLYVWKAINKKYKPSLVVIEYNAEHEPPLSLTVEYDPTRMWDGSKHFGASLCALNHIAIEKGYTLVYCNQNGVNAFFVRNDLLKKLDFEIKNLEEIFVKWERHFYSTHKMIEYPL
jgi:hypothetical protein